MRPQKNAVRFLRERPGVSAACFSFALSVLGWFMFSPFAPFGAYNDDAHYYLAASALVRFGRFVNLCIPNHPRQVAYAAGYPLLLAPLIKIFPDSTTPIVILHFCAFAASAGLFAFIAARRLSFADALTATLWWFLCILPMSIAGAFLSDLPFLTFALAPFAILEAAEVGAAASFAIVFFALFAVLLRPLGILLLPALAVQVATRRSKPEMRRILGWTAVLVGAAVVCLLASAGPLGAARALMPGPLLRGLSLTGMDPGASRAAYAAAIFRSNCVYYGGALFNVLVLPARPILTSASLLPALWILRILWLPAFAAGCWTQLRRRDGLSIFGILYALLILCWFLVDLRYLIPLRPPILLWTFIGFAEWRKRWKPARAVKLLFLAAALYLGAVDAWMQKDTPLQLDEAKYAWIKAHTEPEARIADELDGALHLYTERFAYSYPWDAARTPQEVLDLLQTYGVEYYVVYPQLMILQPSNAQIREAWHQHQRAAVYSLLNKSSDFELVYQSGYSQLYRRRAAAAGG
ncbi:MAG: hypothetical protein ACHQ49_00810 [Elusimicrobiota bacterium]